MRVLTSDEMRELDRATIEDIGLPGTVLMETAGRGAALAADRHFASLYPGPVRILAGKGNNGGDGYVIARCLSDRGWQVQTLVLAPRDQIGGDAAVHLRALEKSGGQIRFCPDEQALEQALGEIGEAALLVDALLGTGLTSEVRGLYALAIDWLNRHPAPVLSVDLPSGIDASSGRILGCCVSAGLTVTFAHPKVGHLCYPAAGHVGHLETVDIGIPASLSGTLNDAVLGVDAAEAAALVPQRPVEGHKGTFGHLLVLAGATGTSGAAVMTALGAGRTGAGLVTVASPRAIHDILEVKLTEAMTVPLPDRDGGLVPEAAARLETLWEGKQAAVLGPGLGQRKGTFDLARQVAAEAPLPLVIDADGLNALVGHLDILSRPERPERILTPHPGELARLCGCSSAQIQAGRFEAAREFARRHGVVLVLKGAGTLIALPDGRMRINTSGNPGLASGGTGDVLAGMIGGLLAQGLPAGEAAVLGTYLHGRAADRVAAEAGECGILATDLLQEIPRTRLELLGYVRSY